MRWVKRGVWAAAWGAWVWCGFGLYRELPRDLGPVVCKVPLADGETVHGFFNDEKELVSELEVSGEPNRIRFWDSETGVLKRELPGPPRDPDRSRGINLRLGVLVASRGERPDLPEHAEGDYAQASLLDLRSGRWTDLPAPSDERPSFHDSRPWCLLRGADELPDEVAVVDVLQAKVVLQWSGKHRPPRPEFDMLMPSFLGDDRLALAFLTTRGDKRPEETNTDRLEIWSISEGRLLETLEGDGFGHPVNGSETGCVAWPSQGEEGGVEVYDLARRARLLPGHAMPPIGRATMPHSSRRFGSAWISRDGTRAFYQSALGRGSLWNVNSGRLIWSGGPREHVGAPFDARDEFVVIEYWFGENAREQPITFACRSLRNGGVKFRSWDYPGERIYGGDTKTYVHDLFGNDPKEIRAIPRQVNYPLLAFCQTILAIPLILLWAVLRWRRKRRMRLAGVAS